MLALLYESYAVADFQKTLSFASMADLNYTLLENPCCRSGKACQTGPHKYERHSSKSSEKRTPTHRVKSK
jgi:hypothetical protein